MKLLQSESFYLIIGMGSLALIWGILGANIFGNFETTVKAFLVVIQALLLCIEQLAFKVANIISGD